MTTHPISFSIHKSKVVTGVPPKTQLLSVIVPGTPQNRNYTFDVEEEYYKEYQRSWYGTTMRKAGCDCMRHYEILANGCIPLFTDLDFIPANTMVNFPYDIVRESNEYYNYLVANPALLEEEGTIQTLTEYVERLLEYTRKHLTNDRIASYVLKTAGFPEAKSVLFLSEQLYPDYLRCITLTGFKDLFGSAAHDYVNVNHLYKDFNDDRFLYGRGFSYARVLDPSTRDPQRDLTLFEDIKNHRYDVVVYGSCYRGLPLLDLVRCFYDAKEIIFLCGEDETTRKPHQDLNIPKESHVFVRELL